MFAVKIKHSTKGEKIPLKTRSIVLLKFKKQYQIHIKNMLSTLKKITQTKRIRKRQIKKYQRKTKKNI